MHTQNLATLQLQNCILCLLKHTSDGRTPPAQHLSAVYVEAPCPPTWRLIEERNGIPETKKRANQMFWANGARGSAKPLHLKPGHLNMAFFSARCRLDGTFLWNCRRKSSEN